MKAKLTIKGERVQDVGYRLFLLERARGLVGFEAYNIGNDLVVLIEGEEQFVKNFIELAKTERPPSARVSEVRVEGYEGVVMQLERFHTHFMLEQMAKLVAVGVEMRDDIKEMKGDMKEMKGDIKEMKSDIKEMKSDIKEMKDDIKEMKEDIKEMRKDIEEIKGDIKEMKSDIKTVLVKQDETIEEVKKVGTEVSKTREELKDELRLLRADLKSYMDERFRRLEEDVRILKERVGLA